MDPSSRKMVESELTVRVSFQLANCEPAAACPSLAIDTFTRESPRPPDIKAALRRNARELYEPTPDVKKFGTFDAAQAGRLTIWQVRCTTCEEQHQFVTLVAQRDVVAMISLQGADLKQTKARLDSLKDLARSVRMTPATLSSPDLITINVQQSDSAIRQQLLELTPLGSPLDTVFTFLDRRIRKDPIGIEPGLKRRVKNFEVGLGRYDNPPGRAVSVESALLLDATVVRGVWRFGRDGTLRDIEVRRAVER